MPGSYLRLDRGLSVDDVADRMLLMTEAVLAEAANAMKILFAIVDGGGNIPPQLAVARALRARGVEIQVLGHRGIRERVEAAGFAFEPFTGGRHFDPTVQRSLAGHHDGLHPSGGGSTSWPVRGGGRAAP